MSKLINNKLSMTSIEIANLVDSRHSDVKRSIERLAERGIIQLAPMAKVENKQSDSPNRFADAYIFEGEQGKRDSIVVVAQLCPEFTARLVDRWQELEEKVELLGSEERLRQSQIQQQTKVNVVGLACSIAEAAVSTAIKTALETVTTQQHKAGLNYQTRGNTTQKSAASDYTHPSLPFGEQDFSNDSDSDNNAFLPIRTLSINTGIPEHVCRRLIEFAAIPTRKTGKHTRLIDSDAFIDAAKQLINESKPPKGRIKRWNHPVFGGFMLRDVPFEPKQVQD
ncbi:TPA: hypothetical protein G5V04_003877 [Salmonella enterica]|nr:hypothetical protein [Salmonella enterica]